MTDGILLAEIQRDRMLRRYDTIIIDEAHERSLNIDFILGYLKQLLPRRPDLKVIITSATIDPQRFSAPLRRRAGHRGVRPDLPGRGALPRARPTTSRPASSRRSRELMREGPGDILVFLSGEREIRDAADALEELKPARVIDPFEVLPLFARLSAADQHRVFAPHSTRRVVLATNVAETSLTVPGIRYVVDTGLARISRYSARTKVQRLPIEPISQASANQRAGRCGRVADGICIRLYAEEDYLARPEFTDPEILRTNLAAVILQMTALGLGDVARFPFVEPPDTRAVQAGHPAARGDRRAVDGRRAKASVAREGGRQVGVPGDGSKPTSRLTPIGRQLAQLPVDPRLGRMLVEASPARLPARGHRGHRGAVDAGPAGAARPTQQEQADQLHRRFADPDSDFAGILNLWRYLKEQQDELSLERVPPDVQARATSTTCGSASGRTSTRSCARSPSRSGSRSTSTPAAAPAIHQALLAGLLSHIGLRDGERRDYQGARGTRFAIFPGSALFKKPPEYVMAAELVETVAAVGAG